MEDRFSRDMAHICLTNSVDPDQTEQAVLTGSTLFVSVYIYFGYITVGQNHAVQILG